MQAFNRMASQLQQAQERLIQVTRVASWQALARKMAHEVKNSLTPIRLTMEEIVSRQGASGRRVSGTSRADRRRRSEDSGKAGSRLFGIFRRASGLPSEIDVNALVEERVSFLKNAHPEVIYQMNLAPGPAQSRRRSGSDQGRAHESAGERRRGRAARRRGDGAHGAIAGNN